MTASSLCDEAVEHLIDLMEGVGPRHLVAHTRDCTVCQRRMHDMRTVAGAVRAMPRVALPRDFEGRLVQELTRRAPRPTRAVWWQIFAGALAITATFALAVWWNEPHAPHVELGLAQRVEVDIAIDTVAGVDAVEMNVALPRGVSVASADPALDGAHTLNWRTPLAGGTNHFPVLLKPDAVGTYIIRVDVTSGTQSASMDVTVRVQPEGHAVNLHTRALPVLTMRESPQERGGT